MNGNKLEKSEEGVPQGGNILPLLSGIMLTKLDNELEARGLHFVRYADWIYRNGGSLVPFINRFPKNKRLYKLMTTKPGD